MLRSRLYEMELEKQQEQIGAERRSMVGTGDRSEKIRTYNFPQNRVTDHRIGLTLHQLDLVMEGKLEPISTRSPRTIQTEKLKEARRRAGRLDGVPLKRPVTVRTALLQGTATSRSRRSRRLRGSPPKCCWPRHCGQRSRVPVRASRTRS